MSFERSRHFWRDVSRTTLDSSQAFVDNEVVAIVCNKNFCSKIIGYFWSRREQSIGMGIMNIKVVKTDGRPLSFVMSGLRGSLGYSLSGLIFGLGYLWFFVGKQQETWHDQIFNTVVLK